ncbi:Protein phosphatase 1 regulatory subunit 3G [Desmophyllum pertusum]|uniref:Protein phosphatase 1 regulatory subunit 3G n=1 Tax=Desmophyllum pertusum TaxID=174260 RepID=A0A9X0CTA2_9CNID|nr:Protein phosphatase 1 regulatory subunit 3G [Desmophyllum pertusum]
MGFFMGNKKRVTFADLLGFSLVSVVEISPRNSFPDICLSQKHPVKPIAAIKRRYFTCSFEQPVDKDDFLERVKRQHVCLESVVCDKVIVRGFVRVLNIAYRKEVSVRYTMDGWKTFHQEYADYLSTSRDGNTDTFFFRIPAPTISQSTCKVEFAICYRVEGNEYWDNNILKNYTVCLVSEE